MPRTPANDPIGHAPCPVRDCNLQCKVFKFRARPNELNRRFAGKLYAVCDEHGRFGGDPKDAGMQAYLQKHVGTTPPQSQTVTPPPAPAEKKSAGGGTPPPVTETKPKPRGFGFFG